MSIYYSSTASNLALTIAETLLLTELKLRFDINSSFQKVNKNFELDIFKPLLSDFSDIRGYILDRHCSVKKFILKLHVGLGDTSTSDRSYGPNKDSLLK